MALAVTEPVAEVLDTGAAQSYATGSFTPTANSLLAVFVIATATVVNGGISGGSLTWTQRLENITTAVHTIYTAQVGASPSAMTVTFDCTGDAATGCGMAVFQVTGHDQTTPVPQIAVTNAGLAAVTPTVTFGSSLNTNNAYLAWLHNSTNPVGVTAPASFTDIVTTGFNNPTTGVLASYRVNGESGTGLTWGASASAWRASGIEIAVAAAGSGPIVHGGKLIKGALVRGGRLAAKPAYDEAGADMKDLIRRNAMLFDPALARRIGA